MKKFYATLLLVCITSLSFAQGIAVQGIARDNTASAITDTKLTFTFDITNANNVIQYREKQEITTDNFGVFSHIVSTGNTITNTFSSLDFSISTLKLKVSVFYNNTSVTVYNQPFQYTPYAHFAKKAANATNSDDGVPTGAVMPFIGTVAPAGWVLCKGQSITGVVGSAALIGLVGNNVPDLQGMFLRGTGNSPVNGQAGPALQATQGDDNKTHNHYVDLKSNTTGNHNHSIIRLPQDNKSNGTDRQSLYQTTGGNQAWDVVNGGGSATNTTGNHTHTVKGNSNNTGSTETRPVNYGVNYIIKL